MPYQARLAHSQEDDDGDLTDTWDIGHGQSSATLGLPIQPAADRLPHLQFSVGGQSWRGTFSRTKKTSQLYERSSMRSLTSWVVSKTKFKVFVKTIGTNVKR